MQWYNETNIDINGGQNMLNELVVGALLHDFGKITFRAGLNSRTSHDIAGYNQILKRNIYIRSNSLDCIRYHHARAMPSALSEESIAYICYHADNIAAGTDRRPVEGDDNTKAQFNKMQSLSSVFSSLHSNDEIKYHNLHIKSNNTINRLQNEGSCNVTSDKYLDIHNRMLNQLCKSDNHSINSILKILESFTAYIPSSTDTSQVTDISLYQHSKLTAAIAGCMYLYMQDNKDNNYKKQFFQNNKEFNKLPAFIMLGCDVSGIQKFIYKVSSKGALKMLRGRSFYLEILTETVIDEILEKYKLSRCNLIFNGGGRFYILLPNLNSTKKIVEEIQDALDKFLLETFGVDLYLALDYTNVCANDFGIDKDNYKDVNEIFIRLSKMIAARKMNRYSSSTLQKLFEDSIGNEDGRECSVCGKQSALKTNKISDSICSSCAGMYDIGEVLVKGQLDTLTIAITNELTNIASFSLGEPKYMKFSSLKEMQNKYDLTLSERIYSINAGLSGISYSCNLLSGDYQILNNDNSLASFDDMLKMCQGIKRIGVFRADIDNLGLAFSNGFSKEKKLSTLSRYAMLSSALSDFFKLHINTILQRKSGTESFYLRDEKKEKGNVAIVYSGGDDLFIVGAYDEVLELGIDLYREFRVFTQNKMTFSAGFGMFNKSYPIYQMSQLTGALEDAAKSNDGDEKDSIALFAIAQGAPEAAQSSLDVNHVYKWDTFIGGVCENKLNSLHKYFSLEKTDKNKIEIGMSLIYKLLHIYRCIANDVEPINIARLAYLLARHEPKSNDKRYPVYVEMKKKMYEWALDKEDSRELVTAITLYIYLNRKEN